MRSEIPQTMTAAAIERFGGPEELAVRSVPVPELGEQDVLIKLQAAGVAVWDPIEREGGMEGLWDHAPRFPYVLGSDGAGVVVDVGARVERFTPGDEVYAAAFGSPKGGTYAEYLVVNESFVARLPRGVPVEAAATLASDGVTALAGLEKLDLKEGESFLLFGASGGVGHIALQLAHRFGVRICAVVSQTDGVELAKRLKAEAIVEGHDEAALDSTLPAFAPEGYDAALVLAGGERCQQALSYMRRGGRVAYPNGVEPVPVIPEGVTPLVFDGIPGPEQFARLNELIEAGPFHLQVHRFYRLDEVRDAHRDVLEHHLGKLALRIH